MNRKFYDPFTRGFLLILLTTYLIQVNQSGIVGQAPLTAVQTKQTQEEKQKNPIDPITPPSPQNLTSSPTPEIEIKQTLPENKTLDNVEQKKSLEVVDEVENKLSRKLYIAKRKYKRKMIIPNEIGEKDKRDMQGFMKNLKTKRALKAYQKNPMRGVTRLSKREKRKRKLKKRYAKNLKYQFHVGALNNVYNMTSNVFPIKNHLQKYDDIAQAYSILAHNYDMFGQKSKEDKFKKQFLYGVEKQRLGDQPPKFISNQVGSSTSEIFLKPLLNRPRLKNENIPDEKKTLKQMEAKVKRRQAKYKAFLKKQNSRRGRRGRRRRRRKRRRFGRRRRRRRRRKLVELDPKKSKLDRKLALKGTKKSSNNGDMIDRILNGSIKDGDFEGNISDMEFGETEKPKEEEVQKLSNEVKNDLSTGSLV
jgi:hypothetical protein